MTTTTAAAVAAATTDLGERLAWTAAVLAGLVVLYLLMWRGWRNRAAGQADLPPLPAAPADLGLPMVDPVRGVYVSSVRAGDWLDRIVACGLGVRSRAVVHVSGNGVHIDRTGEAAVFVSSEALRGIRRAPGMAGKFVGGDGLLVITWELGDALLDTGFRPDRAADSDALMRAISGLVTERSAS